MQLHLRSARNADHLRTLENALRQRRQQSSQPRWFRAAFHVVLVDMALLVGEVWFRTIPTANRPSRNDQTGVLGIRFMTP
jgi:hypothetical protein